MSKPTREEVDNSRENREEAGAPIDDYFLRLEQGYLALLDENEKLLETIDRARHIKIENEKLKEAILPGEVFESFDDYVEICDDMRHALDTTPQLVEENQHMKPVVDAARIHVRGGWTIEKVVATLDRLTDAVRRLDGEDAKTTP